MAEDQVFLQLTALFPSDGDLGKFSESGGNAVDTTPLRQNFFYQRTGAVYLLKTIRGKAYFGALPCHRIYVLQSQMLAVNNNFCCAMKCFQCLVSRISFIRL